MKASVKNTFPASWLLATGILLLLLSLSWTASPGYMTSRFHRRGMIAPSDSDSVKSDSIKPVKLKYPFEDRKGDGYTSPSGESPFYLKDPSNISRTIEYDPVTDRYYIVERIGDKFYRNPTYLTFAEFYRDELSRSTQNYWKQRANEDNILAKKNMIPKIHVGGEVFERVFGGSTVDIRPQGSAELIFGANISRNDNPALPEKQRRIGTFDFDERIQMNVIANIGEKMKLTTNFNTEATFDFENRMKLEYTGFEDEIIKKIEAGNVSLPLSSSLITGSQSLFGVKTQLQFGRMTVTSVLSQQKGKTSVVEVTGGAQTNNFSLQADQYEANKHFFLSQYFKDNFDNALSKLPVIQSGINVSRVEVWITNRTGSTDNTRNILAFMDLGEDPSRAYNQTFVGPGTSGSPYPSNNSNNLYSAITSSYPAVRDINKVNQELSPLAAAPNNFLAVQDYEKIENARRLSPTEYTVNARLGFISLNQSLNNDEVLAVAFEYTINGQTFQVGEFSTGGVNAPEALIIKLLKSSNLNVRLPIWDLMMKNIYAIGAYQVNSNDFRLDVLYADNSAGTNINYLPTEDPGVKSQPLIKLLNLDNLNFQGDPQPDGMFDFIDGVTIISSNGRIIFPVREPFGSYLRTKFTDPNQANKFVFEALYDSTRNSAQQQAELNRYSLQGSYQSSSSSEISLNAINIPQGAVNVTAGGIKLTENIDYTVDYTLGRVKIINEGILNSGTPIKISLESNTLFSIQSKTFMGSRFDYVVSKDFNLGGTVLFLKERPFTRKVNIGDEPIANTIWGVDGTYRTDSRYLTKLIDKLPFIDTKEMSNITVSGEFAQLLPGHPRSIGKTGTSYIDDFEGSRTPIDMKSPGTWVLASTPQGQPSLFPEASSFGLDYGFNRARLAWYIIDPLFYRNNNLTPEHIAQDVVQQSNHFVREVLETELFPFKEAANGQIINLNVMNLAFYPRERGPYNFDVNGLEASGALKSPEIRWGGIMRRIETNDFEAANIEFIEFWLMDPFIYDPTHPGGQLYFNLGNISEDVLKDSRKSYENGLPTGPGGGLIDTTVWGIVPSVQAIVNVFDNKEEAREYQDVGFDGLRNTDEKSFFGSSYLDKLSSVFGSTSPAYQNALKDPSADDYHYFRGPDFDAAKVSILDRYKYYNGVDGNSPTTQQSKDRTGADYPTSASALPDVEDINRDNTLSENENYYQYRVDLSPSKMTVGQNHITNITTATVKLKDGTTQQVKWYQFKVPIMNPQSVVGNIEDFKSIRFMRMFLRGFSKEVILRFGRLDLVRGEWRKYGFSLLYPGEYVPIDNGSNTTFDVSAVNLEENGRRTPVPYVLPPGIERERDVQTTNLRQLNEQSLVMRVCNLEDGDARAAFKNTQFDVRSYKRIKMFVHLESSGVADVLRKGDLTVFVRIGADFTSNYYEYEIPMTPTAWGSTADASVWPEENMLDVELDKLQAAKQRRSFAMQSNPNITLLTPYTVEDGDRKITVVGQPNLSNVRTVMIGVRNPKKLSAGDADDGLPKCGEIWVNELRLTDFDERGGWAANARITAKLADLGTLSLAGSKSTYGFGSLDKKVNERSRVDVTQYDVSSNLELGKFLPEKTGIKVPMYVGYSEALSIPQFNPTDPDIPLKTAIGAIEDDTFRDSIKHVTQDFTKRRSLNFTNVKKNKTNPAAKSRIYDVENIALSYAYTETYRRNVTTQHYTSRNYRGGISYTFSNSPKPVTPFAKSKTMNKYKYLRPLKDFNFNYMPTTLAFRTDVDRQFSETLLRNTTSNQGLALQPTFTKSFTMNRIYDLKYDITRALKFDFNATNNALVDEPDGRIDTEEKRDSVRDNFFSPRNVKYHHTATLNYNLPLSKLPLTDWISSTVQYGVDYDWTRASKAATSLGNTIQNSNRAQANAQLNMTSLYNKVGFLKKINQKSAAAKAPPKKPIPPKAPADTSKGKGPKFLQDSTKKKQNYLEPVFTEMAKLLMTVKNVSFSYSETNGTLLPGFTPVSYVLGMEESGGQLAPGLGFISGSQRDIRDDAVRYGWMSRDTLLNTPFMRTHLKNFTARSSLEPLKGMRIELNANRNFSRNQQEYFRFDGKDSFVHMSPTETGNFSISVITLKSAFRKDSEDGSYTNEIFEQFKNYRNEIAYRLAAENSNYVPGSVDSLQFPLGYSKTSQEVLIPSFLAAYTGKSASGVSLNPFLKIPKPNWRITYDGLSKLPWVAKYFSNITVGHAYRSSFNINSYFTNLSYRETGGSPDSRNAKGDYFSKYEIAQISISEQFSPLLNIDMTLKNSMLARFELKRDRTLSFSLANTQLTEVHGREVVVGLGYRLKQFTVPFKIGGKKRKLSNDLNLKGDFSIRHNRTLLRRMLEDINQPTTDLKIITIKLSADYVVNDRLNIRLFFDKIINRPAVSTTFPTANTNAGVSVRLSLSQ